MVLQLPRIARITGFFLLHRLMLSEFAVARCAAIHVSIPVYGNGIQFPGRSRRYASETRCKAGSALNGDDYLCWLVGICLSALSGGQSLPKGNRI